MKSKLILMGAGLVFSIVLIVALLVMPFDEVEAARAKQLLETGLAEIEVPQPGQTVHYSYTLYQRVPPPELEPADPYHEPYSEIWPAKEFVDTWLQIGPDGKTMRWRTQLRNTKGELLQDLVFNGTEEIDYFPREGRAFRTPKEADVFRDNRVALIEDFLQNEQLSRRQGMSIEGQPVLSVYTEAKQLGKSQSVEEALLNLNRPFIADLKPVSLASRIDFDTSTLLPIGEAQVVWDHAGAEHIISYRTFSDPEILPDEMSQTNAMFRQEIPEQAFQDSFSFVSPGTRVITNLSQIAEYVDYPIYALLDPTSALRLATASLSIPDTAHPLPGFVRGIEIAATLGSGVQTIYVSRNDTAHLSIIQGPAEDIRTALQNSRPIWTQAEQIQVWFGARQVSAWLLMSSETDRLRYVIEADDTLLYVDSQGLTPIQIRELFQAFAPVE